MEKAKSASWDCSPPSCWRGRRLCPNSGSISLLEIDETISFRFLNSFCSFVCSCTLPHCACAASTFSNTRRENTNQQTRQKFQVLILYSLFCKIQGEQKFALVLKLEMLLFALLCVICTCIFSHFEMEDAAFELGYGIMEAKSDRWLFIAIELVHEKSGYRRDYLP